jgi:hypothetical protein
MTMLDRVQKFVILLQLSSVILARNTKLAAVLISPHVKIRTRVRSVLTAAQTALRAAFVQKAMSCMVSTFYFGYRSKKKNNDDDIWTGIICAESLFQRQVISFY